MSVPDPAPHDTAILIGGPKDGQEITAEFVGTRYRPIHAPEPPNWAIREFRADQPAPSVDDLFRIATYEPVYELGFHSRDDQGRLRYRYAGSY